MPLFDSEYQAMSTQQLHHKIAEEAAEIIHANAKLAQYGPVSTSPNGDKYNNLIEVMKEFDQLQAAIRHMCAQYGQNYQQTMSELSLRRHDDAQAEIAEGRRSRVGPTS